MRYWGGVAPCYVLDSVEVDESETAVVVTLVIGRDPDPGNVGCVDIGLFHEVRVDLDRPLGDRDVVDGAQ